MIPHHRIFVPYPATVLATRVIFLINRMPASISDTMRRNSLGKVTKTGISKRTCRRNRSQKTRKYTSKTGRYLLELHISESEYLFLHKNFAVRMFTFSPSFCQKNNSTSRFCFRETIAREKITWATAKGQIRRRRSKISAIVLIRIYSVTFPRVSPAERRITPCTFPEYSN